MIKRIRKFSARFRKEESGATAIEFAIVSPVLAGLFLASLDLGATGFTQNNLTSSLRFSAQYIANGGNDLSVAEDVFKRSYGSYQSFSSTLSCTCAYSRYSLDETKADETQASAADEILGSVNGSLKDAPQCTKSCGDAPVIRYLELRAKALSRPILGTEYTEVTNAVSVRLK